MVDGPNLYLYLNNNPLNDTDPWGLCRGIGSTQKNPGTWIDPSRLLGIAARIAETVGETSLAGALKVGSRVINDKGPFNLAGSILGGFVGSRIGMVVGAKAGFVIGAGLGGSTPAGYIRGGIAGIYIGIGVGTVVGGTVGAMWGGALLGHFDKPGTGELY